MKSHSMILVLAVIAPLSLTACGKQRSNPGNNSDSRNQAQPPQQKPDDAPTILTSGPIVTWETAGDLSDQAPVIKVGLKEEFCAGVGALDLQADFSEILGVICTDQKPNETFNKLELFAAKSIGSARSIQLGMQHTEDGYSKGTYAVVYQLPIAPKWVRIAAYADYLYKESKFDYAHFQGAVTNNRSGELGGTLQYGKWETLATLAVTAPDGVTYTSQRTTEMNSFQLRVGNPYIGIGAERLISAEDGGFRNYQTATVTIGNSDETSTMITLIAVDAKNNGFPKTAEQVFSDISQSQGTHVYNGIMQEYQNGDFNPDKER